MFEVHNKRITVQRSDSAREKKSSHMLSVFKCWYRWDIADVRICLSMLFIPELTCIVSSVRQLEID